MPSGVAKLQKWTCVLKHTHTHTLVRTHKRKRKLETRKEPGVRERKEIYTYMPRGI